MFAPFVQGFLLVGVIYWYTKGMMSVINDYYREEFKDYLHKDPKKELLLKNKLQVDDDDDTPAKKNIDLSPRVEGLPDVLNPEGSIHCRDGIASRGGVESPTADVTEQPAIPSLLNKENDKNNGDKLQQIEKCPSQNDEKVTSASSSPENGATTSPNSDSRQLLDSRERNLKFPAHPENDGVRHNEGEPILNPSAASKSNCEQIINQQVPIIIYDVCKLESTTTVPATTTTTVASATTGTATIFRRDEEISGIEPGNYPGSVGCNRRSKSFSGPTGDDGANKVKTIPTGLSNTLQVDHLRLSACRRKSVNEMIQFWSNFEQNVQND